ncbi:MAG: SOS response-associated peptidase [Pirellulaceae bacterium]
MCGRYTLKTHPDQWGQLLLPMVESASRPGAALAEWSPRYNIAPTQNVLAISGEPDTESSTGGLLLDYFRWGLVPSWAKELSIGNRMINARSETVHEKRSFKGPLEKRRCLVLADGYYEWQKLADGSKQPCWISAAEGTVMALAGLWESNRQASDAVVRSCTILTTAANQQLQEIHDRMPIVMDGPAVERWMSAECSAEEAKTLLGQAEDGYFEVTKVSTLVNNPRNETAECLEPID